MAKEITLRFTTEEIQEKLKKVFKAEHQDLMSECIVGVLSDHTDGLEKVFKASLGISLELKYKVGDIISVRKNGLADWKFNEEKMIEHGIIVNEHMNVKITKVKPYSNYQYEVNYMYYDKDDDKGHYDHNSDLAYHYITGLAEEFPLEL